MSTNVNLILRVLLIVVCAALFLPAYWFWRDNDISQVNRLKEEAKDEYFAREFLKAYRLYDLLIDSLQVKDEAAAINYANAAFMSSNILLNGFYGTPGKQPALDDSTLQDLADRSSAAYEKLTVARNKKIASMASNQLGYSAIKAGDVFEKDNTDSVLTAALEHFKNALRTNPANDSARYNYELVKKILLFPETILAQTKALVAEKKYKEAAALLEQAMKRDRRLQQQKELLTRIQTVIRIDTANTTRI